jgi:hypothetical protein
MTVALTIAVGVVIATLIVLQDIAIAAGLIAVSLNWIGGFGFAFWEVVGMATLLALTANVLGAGKRG